MHMRRGLIVLLAASVQLGCSSEENASPREAPPPVEETVFGDTVSTLDKARAVEATVLQQKEELDRAVRQSEGE
jgi:hypothetical protein